MAVKNKEIENTETSNINKPLAEMSKRIIINRIQILDKPVSPHSGLYSFHCWHKVSIGKSIHQPSKFIKLNSILAVIKELEDERSSNLKDAQKTVFKLYKVTIQINSLLTFIKVWVIPILFG